MSRRSDIIPVAIAVLVPVGLVLALAAAKVVPPQLVSVIELRLNPSRFDGKLVRVHGWIERCGVLDCMVASVPNFGERLDLSDPKKVDDIREHRVSAFSIEASDKFDQAVRPHLDRHIILLARFDATCTRPGIMCFDRVSELKPVSRSPITPVVEN